jgi:hypothetical protein
MKRLFQSAIFFLALLSSCQRELNLSSVHLASDEQTGFFLARNQDTLSSYNYELRSDSVRDKLYRIFPLQRIDEIERGWSCKLETELYEETYFNFFSLEKALNLLFDKLEMTADDENDAIVFLHRELFSSYALASKTSRSDEWKRCENNYRKELSESLLENYFNSNYLRALDACQVIETLKASKSADKLKGREYLVTILECDVTTAKDLFAINKPYILLRFTGSSKLKVEIIFLNETSVFSWI